MTGCAAPTGGRVPSVLLPGLIAAAAGQWARRAVAAGTVPGGTQRWDRRNHRGEAVTLLQGPVAALAAGAGAAATGRWAPAATVAVLGAGAFGALDDLTESAADRTGRTKGFRGHLGALRQGRLTTGAAKILGIGATGLAAALLVPRPAVERPSHPLAASAQVGIDAAVVAGSANLLNLFDLRPGRALKVALLGAALTPGAGRPPVAAVVGAALVTLPDDLAGRSMLGDTGANALGALLGVGVLAGAPRTRRLVLVGLVGLTLLSERVSFTRVIEATPGLRELDALGRP